jgi:hypothetical protein
MIRHLFYHLQIRQFVSKFLLGKIVLKILKMENKHPDYFWSASNSLSENENKIGIREEPVNESPRNLERKEPAHESPGAQQRGTSKYIS